MEIIQPYVLGWLVPTVLSGLLGYVAGLLRKAKAAKKEAEDAAEEEKRSTEKLLEKIQKAVDKLTIMVCRITIYDEHFSTDEKIDAYRTYRSYGENHQTKKHMDGLLGEDADAYLASHE